MSLLRAGQFHLTNKPEATPTIEGMRPTPVSASAILSKAVIGLLLTQLMSSLLSTMASAASTRSPWLISQSDDPQLPNPSSGNTATLKALSDKAFAADKAHDYATAMQWFFKVAQEEERLLRSLNQNNSDSFSRMLREADLDAVRYEIGHHYEFGLGVPQDYEKAAYWYQQAKSDPDAAARLKLLDAGKLPRNATAQATSAQLSMTCVGGNISGGGRTKNDIFNYTFLIKINSDTRQISIALTTDKKWVTWSNVDFDHINLPISDKYFAINSDDFALRIDRYSGAVTGYCDFCFDNGQIDFLKPVTFPFECQEGIGPKF